MAIFPMYLVLTLFFFVLGNVIHFLISLFTKHKVYIDEEVVTLYDDVIIKYNISISY